LTEGEKEPRKRRARRDRQRSSRREEDPVFAGVVVGFAQAVRRMIFGPPPDDAPADDAGTAGSGVPRRPPGYSGSGSVALVEPVTDDSDLDEEVGPHTAQG
jgi:hypothetical protein